MNTSFHIFKRDVRRIFRNRAAALVMVGICLLPSLYAWFNIAANNDPYGNTQNIKIAIANSDIGASTKGISINAGDAIVDNLKQNDQLGWTFTGEEDAIEGVKSGEYYAAIAIPANFSDSLLSILSGNLEDPKLDYYLNEKKNAIAPKMTDTGASTIQQQINDTFTSVASEAVADIVRSAAKDAAGDLNNADAELIIAISDVRDNLTDYQKVLKNFQNTTKESEKLINGTITTLDQLNKTAKSNSKALANADTLLAESRSAVGDFSSQFSQTLSNSETLLNNIAILASTKLGSFEASVGQVNTNIGNSIDSLNQLNQKNQQILDDLEKLHNSVSHDTQLSALIQKQIDQLKEQNASMKELLDSLGSGNDAIKEALTTAQTTRTSLEKIAKESKDDLQDYRKDFDTNVLPQINTSLDGIAMIGGSLQTSLDGIAPMTKQTKVVLNQLNTTLEDTASIVGQAGKALTKADDKLKNIQTDLAALQSSNMYQRLLSLENLDAESISNFMNSPVSIQSKTLFDVDTYGSGMTPFFTNLALWVGGLILVSVIKQEADKEDLEKEPTMTERYFGRWFLYVISAVIQGFIVCLGDLLLLDVQCLHPVYFVLAGMFCSFVYVNIIYALAITFKHIGKAVAVVLVILQIPGSSGTYPIEMMPEFFQKLHPLLPFTYGIDAMRECIAGFYGHEYIKNLLILVIYIVAALLVGLVLRPRRQNLNYLFDSRLAQTDLMLCETETAKNENNQVQLMVKMLMQNKEAKEKFIKKSEKFERSYPKKVKYGFICMIAVPLIFLFLMFNIESELVYLALWVVILIGLATYLIYIEYIHDRIHRQEKLNNITTDDLVQAIKEESNR